MKTNAARAVQRSRPSILHSHPLRISKVFDDPDSVLKLIRERAPYETVMPFHKMRMDADGFDGTPCFGASCDDRAVLYNRNWIAAAKEAFGAAIVRPHSCLINLYGPQAAGYPHLDLPTFRGFSAPSVPVWLLVAMGQSGLFDDWMVPFASGLAWFYMGSDGEFEYWPGGLDSPSQVERPSFWNVGLMSDNVCMWHRIGAIGELSEHEPLRAVLKTSSKLHHVGEDGWELRNGDDVVAQLAAHRLRISFQWKAYVFKDQAHLRSFNDRSLHLSRDQVVEIFRADLSARGIEVPVPQDLFADARWRATLNSVYAPASVRTHTTTNGEANGAAQYFAFEGRLRQ